jgi:UDP-2,4-diacetamido-2,4,6-trideoxy-beta-L-altropyranose hydrolase
MTRLIVRADGNSQIGFGHVMRCLAIVNASQFEQILWFSSNEIEALLQQNTNVPIQFFYLKSEDNFCQFLQNTDLVILDGYQFNIALQQLIHASGAKLVLIDDLANNIISADLIINPTPGIQASTYQSTRPTISMIGLNYALLRPPFIALAKETQIEKEIGSVMICMGGADPNNYTKQILENTIREDFVVIHVVTGAGFIYHDTLNTFDDERIIFHNNLNAYEMTALMSKCEWGIYPSSGIVLEGLAAQQGIIAGITAENQRLVHKGHLDLKTIIDAGDFSAKALTKAFSEKHTFQFKRQIVDGFSLDRIRKMLVRLVQSNNMKLQRATAKDLLQTYKWATDTNVRRFSFQQHDINLEEHTLWFNRKLHDPNCFYYLLRIDDRLVGSIRFDLQQEDAMISYLLDPMEQGKGLGVFILKMGIEQFLSENNYASFTQFIGDVLPENKSSIHIFEQLGFKKLSTAPSLRFTKKYHLNVYN